MVKLHFHLLLVKVIQQGWTITPSFSIELHGKDVALLQKINSFFGVGNITIRKRDNQVVYSVKSLKELHNVIVPHFINYPLLTQKWVDFELFKMFIKLMINKEHLTEEGLTKIVSIRASLGKGLSEGLKKHFPNIIPLEKPAALRAAETLNNSWLAGFVSAEGCFECVIKKSQTTKTGYQVVVRFTINQHSRDTLLFNVIQKHLNCGVVWLDSKKPVVVFSVSDFSSVFNIVIPFFDKYIIKGTKFADFSDFRKIAFIMNDKVHLTSEGLNQIKEIKAKMNRKRDHYLDIQ